MKYHESEEMYLETILLLTKRSSEVRSIDVANELNYSRASVSRAMGLLQKKEYIKIDNGNIKLTESGMKKANDIFERHEIITDLLKEAENYFDNEILQTAYQNILNIKNMCEDYSLKKELKIPS